jgi:collagenase-like PrtC family protease
MSGEAKPAIRFMVGYQLPEGDEESFAEIVRDYRDHVAEVYFPWGDQPSGRAPLAARRGYTDWSAQERLEEDLAALRGMGVGLDLLFNAACYGGMAASRFLANQVVSVIDHLGERVGGIRAVTTTSPAVAHAVKRQFQNIEVRASVNMRIGTVQGMRYLADLFDGYYVQREYNRDLARLRELKSWADGAGKRLYMLANSGCLAFCSGQTFHDNLVAHEREVDEVENIPDWTPHTCWRLLADRANWPFILQATWVRPEDLHHYEGLFGAVKLATRMHSSPRLVIGAYAARRHRGNLLDLLEPGFAPALAPYVLDNGKFPDDWFEHSTRCGRRCEQCGYCAQVLERILTRMDT